MITFDEAVEKVFQHHGLLAGAAETETHWLYILAGTMIVRTREGLYNLGEPGDW